MAGELKRPAIVWLHAAVNGADRAGTEMTYCATEDLRTALELLERANEIIDPDNHVQLRDINKWLEDYKAAKGDA